jgi:hypothetical protein
MRIQEILIESHQLDEGPLLNKIGSAVGKGVGTGIDRESARECERVKEVQRQIRL